MVDFHLITDNNYSLYNFEEEFDMLQGEKNLLPDFSLLTDMGDNDNICSKDEDFCEMFMDCRNVTNADNSDMTTIDTSSIGVSNVATVSDVHLETNPNTVPVTSQDHFRHDEKTVAAVLASLETNSMTPLIKEGLRTTIQSKRIKEGKGEMQVRFTPYIKREPQTDEEIERASRRKEQNKMAARRFRQRQKEIGDRYLNKIKKIEAANAILLNEISNLRKDKEELSTILQNHLAVCQYNPVVDLP